MSWSVFVLHIKVKWFWLWSSSRQMTNFAFRSHPEVHVDCTTWNSSGIMTLPEFRLGYSEQRKWALIGKSSSGCHSFCPLSRLLYRFNEWQNDCFLTNVVFRSLFTATSIPAVVVVTPTNTKLAWSCLDRISTDDSFLHYLQGAANHFSRYSETKAVCPAILWLLLTSERHNKVTWKHRWSLKSFILNWPTLPEILHKAASYIIQPVFLIWLWFSTISTICKFCSNATIS